jgi:hypothetical protein
MAHDLRLISRVRVNVFMFLSFGGKTGPRPARPIIRSRVQHELQKRIFKRLQREGMQYAIRPLVPWTPSSAEKPLH